jgi:hypothetical protein
LPFAAVPVSVTVWLPAATPLGTENEPDTTPLLFAVGVPSVIGSELNFTTTDEFGCQPFEFTVNELPGEPDTLLRPTDEATVVVVAPVATVELVVDDEVVLEVVDVVVVGFTVVDVEVVDVVVVGFAVVDVGFTVVGGAVVGGAVVGGTVVGGAVVGGTVGAVVAGAVVAVPPAAYVRCAVMKYVPGATLLWICTTRSHGCVESHCKVCSSPNSFFQVTVPTPALNVRSPDVVLPSTTTFCASPPPGALFEQ